MMDKQNANINENIKKILKTYSSIDCNKYFETIKKHDDKIAEAQKILYRAISIKDEFQEAWIKKIDKSVKDLDGISNE